jgi:flagellar basal-body rod protein FlgF
MDSVLYTAASGMIAKQRDVDVLANNLANASVNGYRPDSTFYEVWRRVGGSGAGLNATREGAANAEVVVPHVITSSQPGALIQTGAPLDLAIEGDGWFVIQTKGGLRYSRGGALRLAPDGTLTAADGSPVLGKSGPIKMKNGQIEIAAGGRISVDGTEAGTLRLAQVDMKDLEKEGANRYRLIAGRAEKADAGAGFVRQGNLEGPGLNPLEEMVKLVAAQRAFEQHAKTVSMVMNEIDKKAVNDIAAL